ncbi:MAG: hypothetical protein GC179_30745 [Anaerolineaceae bacterium]|nr:hypothetical protein [Anaerolineaceae bacterium]
METVTCDYNGKEYTGEYIIEGGMVKVFYKGKKNPAQIGGHRGYEKVLARRLLGELVRAEETTA